MNKFMKGLKVAAHEKTTENGALAHNTTFNNVVDLFGTIGAVRNRITDDLVINEDFKKTFINSLNEDFTTTIKIIFYVRNIRGGQGERKTFRALLKFLIEEGYKEIVIKNLPNIALFGRYDDYLCLLNTEIENEVIKYLQSVLAEDIKNNKEGKHISLLAKWLPSENASSLKTKALAKKLIKGFGLDSKTYRKLLSKLRKALRVVEKDMSANNWNEIDYQSVPSYAMKNYKEAFHRHDEEGFQKYLEALTKGEAKINASTLFPSDLVHGYWDDYDEKPNVVLEEQWKALPNYVPEESNDRFFIMADVSGSMDGTPMDVSVALAIYFAQRTNGTFKNMFLTFSSDPQIVDISDCKTLKETVRLVAESDWGYSTNMSAAFNKILQIATDNNAKPEEIPNKLVVITDMEIDEGWEKGSKNFFQVKKEAFENAGYMMPEVIWWNVRSDQNTFLAEEGDNVKFVSGYSPSLFKALCESKSKTQYDLILDVINDPIYDCIVVE